MVETRPYGLCGFTNFAIFNCTHTNESFGFNVFYLENIFQIVKSKRAKKGEDQLRDGNSHHQTDKMRLLFKLSPQFITVGEKNGEKMPTRSEMCRSSGDHPLLEMLLGTTSMITDHYSTCLSRINLS